MFQKELQEIARRNKELYFDTGKPCKKGHDSLRYTANGTCITCSKEWSSIYEATPEAKEKSKALQKKNNQTPHRKKWMREYMLKYYQTEKYKEWRKIYDDELKEERKGQPHVKELRYLEYKKLHGIE